MSGPKPKKGTKSPSIIQDTKYSLWPHKLTPCRLMTETCPQLPMPSPNSFHPQVGGPCNENITQITTLCPKFNVRENAQQAPAGDQHQPCTIS